MGMKTVENKLGSREYGSDDTFSSRRSICRSGVSASEQENSSRLMLVSRHATCRESLRQLLDAADEMWVCAEACDTFGALEALQHCEPDVALVDVPSLHSGAIRLIQKLRVRRPVMGVVAVIVPPEAAFGRRLSAAGACACVSKCDPTGVLLQKIRHAAAGAGKGMLSSAYSERLARNPDLTDREVQIFTLCGRGLSRRDVAARLGLSPRTLEIHFEKIRGKTGLDNRGLESYAALWHKRLERAAVSER